jgi:hypothetical protein
MPDSPGLESLFIRLYLDRHIMGRLAVDLRSQGYDVLRTEEAGKDTATDLEQLTFASEQRRSIFTFNIRDFALVHQEWQATGQSHAGISNTAACFSECSACSTTFRPSKMVGNFVHLEQFK